MLTGDSYIADGQDLNPWASTHSGVNIEKLFLYNMV